MIRLTGQSPTPPSDVWQLPLPHGGTSIPERLRGSLLELPRLAVRVIHSNSVVDPVLRNALRAELHLRLGQRTTAHAHARAAVDAARQERPVDADRLLLAAQIAADIACTTTDPGAEDDVVLFASLAPACGDHRRVLLAEAITAVHAYQTGGCTHALDLLDDTITSAHHQAAATFAGMLLAGASAMSSRCRTPSEAVPLLTRALQPSPGGLLHPDLDHPAYGYLRSRVTARPGRHTCRPPLPDHTTMTAPGAGQATP
ncbi:hypothetical protein [Paractinoplanes toevensis]|uniref:Uncharacterized protein n=1 Tax=Paractinoplanes toevensis TaxID=571911 RepID=A0A919W358_9ACTN|nr:hypothetical protein [Actinoplanes toevensis]GIM94397.1 hypothetical protein Ato02nite_061900 [Actinoplanes toevensis]